MCNITDTSVNKEKNAFWRSFLSYVHNSLNDSLMSAKQNIALPGSNMIFLFSSVNLILNIDIEKVFIGNKYHILIRKLQHGQQKYSIKRFVLPP